VSLKAHCLPESVNDSLTGYACTPRVEGLLRDADAHISLSARLR